MSSFSQWARSSVSHVPKVTWVCGTERVLVEEVVSSTVAVAVPYAVERWTAGRSREKDIWTSVLTTPFMTEIRLILVRDAAKLKNWEKFRTWMEQRSVFRGCYLVFVSYESDFPRDAEGKLAEPCTWLRDSTIGQIVRCSPLSSEDAVSWVMRQMPGLALPQAMHLLDRAAGNLSEIRTVLAKAKLFGGNVTDQALDLLCSEMPGDFADKLISGNRKAAMLAAESLGPEGISYSIGLLASRLDTLAMLHRAVRDNVSRRDIITRLGVPAFLAQKYAVAAREYGEDRVSRCWGVLAMVEDAYRSGAADGAAEVLVAVW